MKFSEIYDNLSRDNKTLISQSSFFGKIPDWFLNLYFERLAYESLDRYYLVTTYGYSECAFDYGSTLDITVTGILERNRYKFDNLYRTIIQEYNPIENYDRMEDTTLDIDGSNTDNTKTDSTTVKQQI